MGVGNSVANVTYPDLGNFYLVVILILIYILVCFLLNYINIT